MRYAMVTLLIITSTVATAALAQDGAGQGPPYIIIAMPQLPVPTTSGSTVSVPKLVPPQQSAPTSK